MTIPVLSYVDDELIDEMWMLLKKDGVPIERINKVNMALEGKVSFGLGHLFAWLVSDLRLRLPDSAADHGIAWFEMHVICWSCPGLALGLPEARSGVCFVWTLVL